MNKQYLFPMLLIIIDFCSSLVYAIDGDWKKAVYWIAAMVLNITVTF